MNLFVLTDKETENKLNIDNLGKNSVIVLSKNKNKLQGQRRKKLLKESYLKDLLQNFRV